MLFEISLTYPLNHKRFFQITVILLCKLSNEGQAPIGYWPDNYIASLPAGCVESVTADQCLMSFL